MITDNITQRSPSWFRARLGHITGSQVADIMSGGRTKGQDFSQTALSYLYKVAGERLLNPALIEDDDTFLDYIEQTSVTTRAMAWGQDMEEPAKELLLRQHPEWELSDVSSCKHDNINHFAASPDAIVYDREKLMTVEIKCPNVNTHIKYMANIKDNEGLFATEPKYYWQVMAEMSCTNADAAIFVSYNPWLTKPIHIVNIARDDEAIKKLEERVKLANEYIENIINEKLK